MCLGSFLFLVLLPGIEPGFFLPQRNVLSVERRELSEVKNHACEAHMNSFAERSSRTPASKASDGVRELPFVTANP